MNNIRMMWGALVFGVLTGAIANPGLISEKDKEVKRFSLTSDQKNYIVKGAAIVTLAYVGINKISQPVTLCLFTRLVAVIHALPGAAVGVIASGAIHTYVPGAGNKSATLSGGIIAGLTTLALLEPSSAPCKDKDIINNRNRFLVESTIMSASLAAGGSYLLHDRIANFLPEAGNKVKQARKQNKAGLTLHLGSKV